MWTIEARRAYLIKMRFSVNKVNSESDEWVIRMTSQG